MTISIFTDGSSRGNPGPSGWAAILKHGEHIKEISGGLRLSTNNRSELLSVIKAIQELKIKSCDLDIYSDSSYVVNSISKGWVDTWEKNSYKDRKNSDLWIIFQEIRKDFNINMIWVKGHANNEFNNRCDILATAASSENNKNNWLIDTFYENLNK